VPSLLITDDDRDFRETVCAVFDRRGFHTFMASSGEQALEVVTRHEIHLALVDMHMPRWSGIETMHRLRQSRRSLPCILISGQLDDEIRSQAAADAYCVLSKSIDFRELTKTVTLVIRDTYNWPGFLPDPGSHSKQT
jgi:DNA-binding response OmpR family regulator